MRVSFATNDERTAKRVSDALGTATEMRAMKNYAGHRLSPWLGHLMVSRQETARPLLTPGEVMQLPPDDEIVLVSGCHPIRAKKARYYEDPAMQARILPPPHARRSNAPPAGRTPPLRAASDWAGADRRAPPASRPRTRPMPASGASPNCPSTKRSCRAGEAGPRVRARWTTNPTTRPQRQRIMQRTMGAVARQVSLDPGDDMQM